MYESAALCSGVIVEKIGCSPNIRISTSCNEIILQDNNNLMANLMKMNALEAIGKYKEVLQICDKLLTKSTCNNIDIFLIQAEMFAYLKDYTKSMQIYNKLIKICEKRMNSFKSNPQLERTYNIAKFGFNIIKINSNRQLSIMEGFDFLVNYILISFINY